MSLGINNNTIFVDDKKSLKFGDRFIDSTEIALGKAILDTSDDTTIIELRTLSEVSKEDGSYILLKPKTNKKDYRILLNGELINVVDQVELDPRFYYLGIFESGELRLHRLNGDNVFTKEEIIDGNPVIEALQNIDPKELQRLITGTEHIIEDVKGGIHGITFKVNGKAYVAAGGNSGFLNPTSGRGAANQVADISVKALQQLLIPERDVPIKKIGYHNYTNSYVLLENGNLYAWGKNTRGQCGAGHSNVIRFPTLVATNVVDVFDDPTNWNYEPDYNRLFIKKSDGYIYGAGFNDNGALGLSDTRDRASFTKIEYLGTEVEKIYNIGTRYGFTIALRKDGRILMTGFNGNGQFGNGTKGLVTTFVDVTDYWIRDGFVVKKIVAFNNKIGNSVNGVAMLIENPNTGEIKILSAGYNGEGFCGTNNTTDQHTPVEPLDLTGRFIDIALAGYSCVKALRDDGVLYSWGYSGYGQVGYGSKGKKLTPVAVATDVIKILDNQEHHPKECHINQSFIVKKDGIYGTGYNGRYQLGIGVNTNMLQYVKIPVPVRGDEIKFFAKVPAGIYSFACFLVTNNNEVYVWGGNDDYILSPYRKVPVVYPNKIKLPNIY